MPGPLRADRRVVCSRILMARAERDDITAQHVGLSALGRAGGDGGWGVLSDPTALSSSCAPCPPPAHADIQGSKVSMPYTTGLPHPALGCPHTLCNPHSAVTSWSWGGVAVWTAPLNPPPLVFPEFGVSISPSLDHCTHQPALPSVTWFWVSPRACWVKCFSFPPHHPSLHQLSPD